MAVSVTVPAANASRLSCGKIEIECPDVASLRDWADRQLPDDTKTFAIALAVLLSRLRPGTRGKTLTVDLAAPANLVTVV